jgi:glycine cleavage system H protein
VVESVKTASDIFAPVSGEVTAINDELVKKPELVNSDPYGAGWFFKVKVSHPEEVEKLLSPADYAKEIGG